MRARARVQRERGESARTRMHVIKVL